MTEFKDFEGSIGKSSCDDIYFYTGYGYEDEDELYRVRDTVDPEDFNDLERRLVNKEEFNWFKFIFLLCGLIKENSKYLDEDWLLTERGIEMIPIAIIYDKVANRLCASVDIFDTFECDGHIAWQVKCYKRAYKEIKNICKRYKLLWPGIKMHMKLDIDGLTHNITKNNEYDANDKYSAKYFSNRVLRLWFDINLNKLTDVQLGTVKLLGRIKCLNSLDNTLDSKASLWVKE